MFPVKYFQYSLLYKCKQNLNLPVFRNVFTHRSKNKYAFRNESSIQKPLCRINFSQYCISYCGPCLWNKIVILKNLIFSDSDSFQEFLHELKRFLLSIELNDLEILKQLLSPRKSISHIKMIPPY